VFAHDGILRFRLHLPGRSMHQQEHRSMQCHCPLREWLGMLLWSLRGPGGSLYFFTRSLDLCGLR
jgi:hypothetical protein